VTRLRPLTQAHLRVSEGWLPSLPGVDDDLASAIAAARARGEALAVINGDAAGLLTYETNVPERGAARIKLLAVAPDRRRLGIGGRAAIALERRLARAGIERAYVIVPSDLGLAFYFWLRLGYRPLLQRDWPAPVEGKTAAWMLRDLR
jgi:GNAT superfamily N-acetyltransferase